MSDDGCLAHDVTHEQVQTWWAEAEKRDAVVSMCVCCRNPCSVDAKVCKLCADADIDALRKSWTPRD